MSDIDNGVPISGTIIPLEKRVKKLEGLTATIVRASQELERVSVGLIKRTDTLAISVDKLSLAVREIQQKFN